MIGDVTKLYLVQEDAASTHGKSAMCSGAVVNGGSGLDHAITRFGTPGATPVTVTIGAGATEAAWFLESGATGLTFWDPGIWMVPIETDAASSSDISLEEVHVCRLDSAGASLGSIASATGLGRTISGAGIEYVQMERLTGLSTNATDRIGVVGVFTNAGAGAETIDLLPSQAVRTPLVMARIVRVEDYRAHPDVRRPHGWRTPSIVVDGLLPEIQTAISVDVPLGEIVVYGYDATQFQVITAGVGETVGAPVGSP